MQKAIKPNLQLSHRRFTKAQRLLTAQDFKQVFDHTAFKVHTTHLLFFVRVRHDQNAPNRLGLAIAKKKIKRAHERNRLKRLLREYFRQYQAQLPCAVEMAVIAKQDVSSCDNANLLAQIAQAFEQITRKSLKMQRTNV